MQRRRIGWAMGGQAGCGAVLAALVILLGQGAGGQAVPNADFDQGDERPEGWQLSGTGRWVDRQVLEVSGNGKDSSQWSCQQPFAAGELYHFQMRVRRSGTQGSAIGGPEFANRDYRVPSGEEWTWLGHVFRAPDNAQQSRLRLGHWHADGAVQFDGLRLGRAVAVHREVGGLTLGEGERIRGGVYNFQSAYSYPGSNYQRPLAEATAGFNSDRWNISGDGSVTYCFQMPGHRFLTAKAGVRVNYHVRGSCLVEVSRDGAKWTRLLSQDNLGEAEEALPAELLPADALWVRFRAADAKASLQVNRLVFEGQLDGDVRDSVGSTSFADIESDSPALMLGGLSLVDDPLAGRMTLDVNWANQTDRALAVRVSAKSGQDAVEAAAQAVRTEPGQTAGTRLALAASQPGEHEIELHIAADKVPPLVARLRLTVCDFYRTDYGRRIAGGGAPVGVWWCDATHKIHRQRALPEAESPAAELSAARHDWEAVQVVVRPEQNLRGLTAAVDPLQGPEGAVIGADKIRVLRAYYHYVEHPTDRSSVQGQWPDALPPLDQALDVAQGANQPLWVLVYVPEDARPGDYRGQVRLQAEGWSAVVPLRLHVWNFALPRANHLETAFGLNPSTIFRYHNLKSEADRRRVLDLYFQSLSEHRISPYDPTPLDPIQVKFLPDAQPPRAELDFTAFDAAMERALKQWHFTGFRLPVQGMGGGTFHKRHEPKILKFCEDTPQYKALFASYVGQLESHLRAKGWLKHAYVYWFDEPEPKDYEFVRGGMERLRQYAPGLRRMLTEEPGDALGEAIDIWCPLTPKFDPEKAQSCRSRGEHFWWYVCCSPKAPYCTLFIDHPATELRVWQWQTWQRGVDGILVWTVNYWTSDAAYPHAAQNPYEDPMGYVSSYNTAPGERKFWGNGDGRFIYPPEKAAVPGSKGAEPVIAGPVSSIRWEMLREGIEDYEYLYLLRERLEQRRASLPAEEVRRIEGLLEVPEAITSTLTRFATHPAPIYERRAAVAEAIERLGQ